jgi:hypothetical protein
MLAIFTPTKLPFYREVRSQFLEAVQVLFDAGSDVDGKTFDEVTSLAEALE